MAVEKGLKTILDTIQHTVKQHHLEQPIRLVAVSKFQSVDSILQAYQLGHRVFGENYVQELVDKASQLPEDIEWHFIGHLQRNKVKKLLEVKNISAIESVDSVPLAIALNKACITLGRTLPIFIQINTSREESKSGISPDQCALHCQDILQNCTQLRIMGLMTIGHPQRDPAIDFNCLRACRDSLINILPHAQQLELSMGMSKDYPLALQMGATNVRVGSAIFGQRK